MTPKKKERSSRRGGLVDTWVGDKPRSTFEGWLRAFKKRYRPDQPDYRDLRGSKVQGVGRVDPVAAYRFQRLPAQDLVRFRNYFRQLALLGYDLGTFEGIDKFWRLKQTERDRLYYQVQDPDKFRKKVREDFFEEFRRHFTDFQKRFAEFFEHFQESEPSFNPDDLAAHYRFLGLSTQADVDQVKDRYRILAFKFHPDQGGDEDKMKALNIAYAAVLRAIRAS